MPESVISDAYVLERLRNIAKELEDGISTLTSYNSGEGCNSSAFSSHSLTINWTRNSQELLSADKPAVVKEKSNA